MLDDNTLPNDRIEVVRKGLKEEEQQAAGQLASEARDVLGQLEAADLPVDMLARALDELRLAQSLGHDAAAVSLERLRVVAALPWAARAPERVDIEAAMAELEAAYSGRLEIKACIRRFLATRRLTSAAWTWRAAPAVPGPVAGRARPRSRCAVSSYAPPGLPPGPRSCASPGRPAAARRPWRS